LAAAKRIPTIPPVAMMPQSTAILASAKLHYLHGQLRQSFGLFMRSNDGLDRANKYLIKGREFTKLNSLPF
jgi:hypothetical protein